MSFVKRINYFYLILLVISLIFLSLLNPIFPVKIVEAQRVRDCQCDEDCTSYFGDNYCCTNNGRPALCNQRFDAICSVSNFCGEGEWGTCDYTFGGTAPVHTGLCPYGCSTYNGIGYCNSPPRCSNPDGANDAWIYDCSPATAGGCTVAEGCVGYPMHCESGTWVNKNTLGECTTDCTNCTHAKYKCSGASCIQDDTNGTFTSSDCNNTCTATIKYKCSGTSCIRDDVNGNFSTSNCNNTCTVTAKYKCSGTSCIRDDVNGNYTSSNCDNACTVAPPSCAPNKVTMNVTPNPVNAGSGVAFSVSGTDNEGSTYIGDTWSPSGGLSGTSCNCTQVNQYGNDCGIWGTKNCTAATANSYTWTHYWSHDISGRTTPQCSKTATYTINNPIPPTPTITPPSCIFNGYNGSGVNISWAAATPAVTYVDIAGVSNFSSYYHKAVTPPATSTTAPTGFNGYRFPGNLTLNPGTTYYVRTWNGIRNSGTATFNIPLCVPAAPTVLPPSCSTPVGDSATVSWNPSIGATAYLLRVDNLADPWNGTCTSPKGDFCSTQGPTSNQFTSIPGSTYSWWVHACNGAGCSAPSFGTNFTCALPACPGGLGNCGSGPPPPRPNTIGPCNNNAWQYTPGQSLAYNIWCATNANPTRGYCYQCNTNITPWIQTTGDVHSNTGINAPGGP